MGSRMHKTVVICPVCGYKIVLKGKAGFGRRIACLSCGAESRVIRTEPITLGRAFGE